MDNKIEFNAQFKKALDTMENTSNNILITGRAGTGKSTLLNYFKENTEKQVAVIAPTGVAAVNIKGVTIHSFCGFKPGISPGQINSSYKVTGKKNIYKKLDAIVIDEISMVRADLLDCVDKFLRLNCSNKYTPFGGIQMIFIGDLYQLPPVVVGEERKIFSGYYNSPYFFSSKVFEELRYEFIELIKVYRQKDDRFISILNAVRNRSIDNEMLETLNKRFKPDFSPPPEDFYIYLTTTNDMAKQRNDEMLARLKGKIYRYKAKLKGEFDEKSAPARQTLEIKKGAQVMMVNNDQKRRWINGTIGKIKDIEKGNPDVIYVRLMDGRTVGVQQYTWEIFRYRLDPETNALDTEIVGSFKQYPMILAWAVTIHKSQGKTFDKVVIDLGRGSFAHGQTYVAISRCTSLDGLVLKKPVEKKHILMDWRVVRFLTECQYRISEDQLSLDDKINMIKSVIKSKGKLKIVYLKASDDKSSRTIKPLNVGEMSYNGRKFNGMEAYCYKSKDNRTFRVDRILEMKAV